MVNSLNSLNTISSFSQQNLPIKKEEEDWEVLPNQNLKITITSPEEQAKAVVLFIHGGPRIDFEGAIKTQEPFFTDLAEKKFVVIAPYFPYDQINEPGLDYRDLIDGTAQKIADKFSSLPLYVISHSYGGHLTGRTLLRDNALSQNIKKWVVMSGTTHHGAGSLRRGLSDIVTIAKKIPKDQDNRIVWEDSCLSFNPSNAEIFANYLKIFRSLMALIGTDESRFSLDGYKKVDCINNSLFSKAFNKEFSVQYQFPKLEHRFPVLIMHPTEDCAVTVDVGLEFFKALQKREWPVQFATEGNSPHNWMIKGTPHTEDPSYQQLFGVLNRFLANDSLDTQEVENAVDAAEAYLKENPDLNYMELFRSFHRNEPVTFTSFDNSGLRLTREERKRNTSVKRTCPGIKETEAALDLFNDPFKKNLQEIQLMITEIEAWINTTDKKASSDDYRYYAYMLLPTLKKLAKKMSE